MGIQRSVTTNYTLKNDNKDLRFQEHDFSAIEKTLESCYWRD